MGRTAHSITIPGNNTARLRTFPVQQLDHRRKPAHDIPLILLILPHLRSFTKESATSIARSSEISLMTSGIFEIASSMASVGPVFASALDSQINPRMKKTADVFNKDFRTLDVLSLG